MIPLHLPASFARQIEKEGAAAYPNECCGVIFGRDVEGQTRRIVERIVPMENAFDAAEQFHRFSITAKQLMWAEKEAAKEDRLVLGFYHSHPDHPARPSETDRQYAWPFYSYVIVAIANRIPRDTTSWMLDEKTETFSRQEIVECM
jgi:proteasome lid subunit RPN8/RPN11